MTGPLLPDGRDSTDRIGAGQYLPKRPLTFGPKVRALAPFTERLVFFTPGLLYLWGRFTDRVLFHFLELQGRGVDFFHTKFPRPLFQGLDAPNGDRDWNHVLWALEREHWPAFEAHVLAAVLHDDPRQLVIRYGSQDLQIYDPLAAFTLTPAYCPIIAFGVRSNKFSVSLNNDDKLAPGPKVQWNPADAQCKLYAEAMFQRRSPDQAVNLMRVEPKDEDQTGLGPGH